MCPFIALVGLTLAPVRRRHLRSRPMPLGGLPTIVLAVLLVACASPASSPSPSTVATGVEGLVEGLTAAAVPVRQADRFDAAPLPGHGVLLCIGREEVRVYSFASEQERANAAGTIDPADPSQIGTSIVEWAGNPRFWQRDRILVLYLGSDGATEAALSSVLGPPFARGVGRGPGGPGGPLLNSC